MPPLAESSAELRARRRAWLASVRAALVEAIMLVDAVAAEGVDAEQARARLIPARRAVEALRAAIGEEPRRGDGRAE